MSQVQRTVEHDEAVCGDKRPFPLCRKITAKPEMRITQAQLAIIELLTWHVRAATDDQVQQILHDQAIAGNASEILRQLARSGFIHRRRMNVAVTKLSKPLCSWLPGQSKPQLERLAWQLFVRHEQSDRRQMQVNLASPKAANLSAGVSGWGRQPLQLEHDLGTTAMYVSSRPYQSDVIWYGEDIVRRRIPDVKKKVPDAILVDRHENILKVIEYGGQYSRRRLEDFHRHWQHHPWEIW